MEACLPRRVIIQDRKVEDERRVEGNDWAMAAKPEGRPEPEGRLGMRSERE